MTGLYEQARTQIPSHQAWLTELEQIFGVRNSSIYLELLVLSGHAVSASELVAAFATVKARIDATANEERQFWVNRFPNEAERREVVRQADMAVQTAARDKTLNP